MRLLPVAFGITAIVALVVGSGVQRYIYSRSQSVNASQSSNVIYVPPTPPVNNSTGTGGQTSTQPRPSAPTGLHVGDIQTNSVTLDWDNVPNFRGEYLIYRSQNPNISTSDRIGIIAGSRFTDEEVSAGATWYYWVVAQDTAGESQPSTMAKAVTPLTWDAIHNAVENSVVMVKTYDTAAGALGSFVEGTGWFATGGYVVTNWHVVKDWNWAIDVYLNDDGGSVYRGQKYHATIRAVDKAHDLAILRLDNGWSGRPLTYGGNVSSGESVAALGHPGAAQLTMTEGEVVETGINETVSGLGSFADMVSSNIPSVPGSSGSPVLDRNGNVVGVMESADSHNGNISYFVPVQYVDALIKNGGR